MKNGRLLARCIAPVAVTALALGVASGAGAAPAKAPSQAKSDLIIGNISNATGSGLPSDGAFQTVKAWAKDVNSRGGVNGYKVVVKTADDKADPAKASEAMKTPDRRRPRDRHRRAVRRRHASVWLPIADAARVPVISGGCYSSRLQRRPELLLRHDDRDPRRPLRAGEVRGRLRREEVRNHLRRSQAAGRGSGTAVQGRRHEVRHAVERRSRC